jgi:hypothetical protein
VGGAGKAVYVYDADSEELLKQLEGTSDVTSVAVFEDEQGGLITAGYKVGTIKVWDSGAPLVRRELKIAPPCPKLIPVGLSGRCAGAVEREDERPHLVHHIGGVFSRRDQDHLGIARQDDQSLGFGCAKALKIAPP